MGARQSVAQTQRQRTQSSTTIDSGHSNAPSTSVAVGDNNTETTHFTIDRQTCGREHRELRTRSATVPDTVELNDPSTSDENPSSSHISSSAGVASTSGFPTLERLLRFSSLDETSTAGQGTRPSNRNRMIWLRPFQFRLFDIQCPVCHKTVPSDDVEFHLVVCLTKPRLNYNEEVLNDDKEECIICFDEMVKGDTIARLPCLCIYHKKCIDAWFKIKNVCPEHPGED